MLASLGCDCGTALVAVPFPGPPGPPGPPGSGSTVNHVQAAPAAVWTVPYNPLQAVYSVLVLVGGQEVTADVDASTPGTVTITHAAPLSGSARLILI